MPELIQITTDGIPPLRQSTAEVMSCKLSYVETFIKGRKQPGGLEASRGTQVHNALARYASWCAHKRVSQDLEAFDRFAEGVGLDAHKILAGVRDTYEVDFNSLFATEISMSLDEKFRPTDIGESMEGTVGDSGEEAAYQGTLDTLYVFRDQYRINIDDFKTHVRPYDPADKLQGKEYSLFVFQHFPWVQEVRFRLIFVRYSRLYREVIYRRSDLPQLINTVRSSRVRQRMIHEDYENGVDIEPTAGTHCWWCPLLSDASCPIAEYNGAMQLTMQQRMNFALFYGQFSRINNAIMKDYVQATGKPIVMKDGNGKYYKYGPEEKQSKVYPVFKKTPNGLEKDNRGNYVMPIVELLVDHAYADEEDTEWLGNLSISATKLEGYLKAKKRAITHMAIQDAADPITKVSMRISKPLDHEPPDDEDDEDEEDF